MFESMCLYWLVFFCRPSTHFCDVLLFPGQGHFQEKQQIKNTHMMIEAMEQQVDIIYIYNMEYSAKGIERRAMGMYYAM